MDFGKIDRRLPRRVPKPFRTLVSNVVQDILHPNTTRLWNVINEETLENRMDVAYPDKENVERNRLLALFDRLRFHYPNAWCRHVQKSRIRYSESFKLYSQLIRHILDGNKEQMASTVIRIDWDIYERPDDNNIPYPYGVWRSDDPFERAIQMDAKRMLGTGFYSRPTFLTLYESLVPTYKPRESIPFHLLAWGVPSHLFGSESIGIFAINDYTCTQDRIRNCVREEYQTTVKNIVMDALTGSLIRDVCSIVSEYVEIKYLP